MAASRVYWNDADIKLMLSVFEDKKILKLIDGKKYRRIDIFKIIEKEFKERGIEDKTHIVIDNKWKNLKKQYVNIKKDNNRSGEGRNTCDYFEQLDRLLATRPSTSLIINGIDSSAPKNIPGE